MKTRTTVPHLRRLKQRGDRIVMLTCYDYATALLIDGAGVDVVLVGDSVGTTVLGHETTIPVTMDDMVRHTRAVRRGLTRPLLVADLPFLSYQVGPEDALRNAGRLVQEGGAEAVKLEGGLAVVPAVERIVAAGIPVMGHLGLTPQSVHALGGYRVQGRDEASLERLLADAAALAEAGVFALVLELVHAETARQVTAAAPVPTIGIGSGPHCDGQVQVVHDILGLFPGQAFRHAARYAEVGELIQGCVTRYAADVRSGRFPAAPHSVGMDEAAAEAQPPGSAK